MTNTLIAVGILILIIGVVGLVIWLSDEDDGQFNRARLRYRGVMTLVPSEVPDSGGAIHYDFAVTVIHRRTRAAVVYKKSGYACYSRELAVGAAKRMYHDMLREEVEAERKEKSSRAREKFMANELKRRKVRLR